MSSGFQSNYNDSGYTPSGPWYDQNNNLITTIPSRDIYLNTQQVGVYMLNGTFGNTVQRYPIFCSLSDLRFCGIPIDDDDAWLVYPGFGFQLFDQVDYKDNLSFQPGYLAESSKRRYINTSNIPLLFTYPDDGGFQGKGSSIKNIFNTGVYYGNTASVKIYFRGTEITVNGLSEKSS